MTHLSIRPFESDELIRMPALSVLEGLKLIRLVCPYLRSLCIINHCFDNTAFQFGSCCVKINNVNYSELLKIIGENCFNLEEVHINNSELCYECAASSHTQGFKPDDVLFRGRIIRPSYLMTMIVKNNPKLWTFSVFPVDSRGFEVYYPDGMTIPSLRHITIYSSRYSDVRKSLLLSEKFSVIELDNCTIRLLSDLSDFVDRILLQKNLQRLSVDFNFSRINFFGYDYAQQEIDQLGALRNCPSLRELEIQMDEVEKKKLSGNFIKYIIKGCRRLEVVHVANLIIDNETQNQLRSLPYAKDIHVSSTLSKERTTTKGKDYFTSKL